MITEITCQIHNTTFNALDGCPDCLAEIAGDSVQVTEEWTPDKHTVTVEGVTQTEDNPLGMIPVVEMPLTLEQQIAVVSQARQKAAESREKLSEARSEWESKYAVEIGRASAFDESVKVSEALLRELALMVYAADPTNKKPAPGVGIQEVTKLAYDSDLALKWGIEHNMALQLNKGAFETIAKNTPIDFVTIITEPRATISPKLGEKDGS